MLRAKAQDENPHNRAASTNPNSLPQRWKRGRQQAAFVALVALGFFTGSLYRQGGADELDSWWLRARFSLRELLNNRSGTPTLEKRMIRVDIDDDSIDGWKNEPIVLWGKHFAKVTDQLNRSGARVLAFDYTQTIPVDSLKFGPDYKDNDDLWGAALMRAKNVVFVKFVRSGRYVLPYLFLLYATPGAYKDGGDSNLGFAELRDGVQYSYLPQAPLKPDGKREVSFGLRIAQKMGAKFTSRLPLRPDGSFLINFADNTGLEKSPFETVSFFKVARQTQPDPRFKDKIVFIGSSYRGNNDRHTVAFLNGLFGSRQIDGVEVHMNAVANMLDGNAIIEPSNTLVLIMAFGFGIIGISAYAIQSWGRATLTVGSVSLAWLALSVLLFWKVNFALPFILPFSSLMLGVLLMGGHRALSEERERRQVMKIWGKYQDPRLIKELLEHPNLRSGQGREVEVTVLFVDLKNFTKTIENLTPAEALIALNQYLALFARIIRQHNGMVDKYLGDGLMAQWGAPVAQPDHATLAVRACLEIERQTKALTQSLNKTGQVSFEVRLTLHTGPVVAGPLGDDEKLEYTLIGDTVNVTSRLQETAKALGCDFLISEMTCAAMSCKIRTGRETEVAIRGRQAPLRVFEALDNATALPCGTDSSLSQPTTTAKTFLNSENS